MNNIRNGLVTSFTAALVLLGATACEPQTVNATPLVAESTQSASPPPSVSATTPSPVAEDVEPTKTKEPSPSAEPSTAVASAGTVLAQLETIPIKGRAPKTGYDRDLFGNGWKDPDRNGCDARNDMLNRDLTEKAHKPGTQGCVVTSGVLADPFTATTINFVRGNATSTKVQIDHVVALSDAWQKGAQQLAPNQREAFGNDPLNLLAVDGPTNGSKGDGDAATWLPSDKSFQCEYVGLQTAVKAKYGLWMTQAEHDAIRRILIASCPDQPVPADDGGVLVPVAAEPAPAAEAPTRPQDAAVPKLSTGTDVFYQNCSAVRAAGAAPIRAGDPGWDTKFDRDSDGVGCE
ncbi:Excalibur calcium-binding domain-containing protein [Arthrobacter crystallopoietes]|uniref:Excalibur calcium-binding domain-containing protein n=1 Tax=Crystallibacter crystallopoietes TaxID=37928 RepID=A0A1H1G292_9MICC|nr:deoxyribonuclease [Arthrobacter crystallopoietes]SDR06976.1 Excalibur calcium-binding domain-containing protein [Arthrobacter crystallopoietes]